MTDEPDLETLERRRFAVQAVRQIGQAVWALARAQLPLVGGVVGEATQYLDWVDEVLERVAGRPRTEPSQQQLLVVMGPERPFCGNLAGQILKQLPHAGRLGLVGERLSEAARSTPELAARVEFELAGAAAHDETESIAVAVAEAVMRHAGKASVELLHPSEGSATLHRSVLLATSRDALTTRAPETYSPSEAVIAAALQEAITGRLVVAAAEALRSETLARIQAAEQVKSATDKRLAELEQAWRVARQEQITSELLEVVAGRQATRSRLQDRTR